MAAVATRQGGRIRYDQLRAAGAAEATISKWIKTAYLLPVLPRVWAVGHAGRSVEADLAAALLYAGPGAQLSHGTGVWWLGLLKYPPADQRIHVSTPRSVKSLGRIVVHSRRRLPRISHNGLPTTTPAQALLDFAGTDPAEHLLRIALANAEYRDLLDPAELKRLTGRGIAGSAAIKHALKIHLPQLAATRSDGEVALLALCQNLGLPIPQMNVYIHGWLVDAVWPDRKLIVEIDGYQGHRTKAQLERDHRRDLELRAAGYTVLRYTWDQLEHQRDQVAADLARYF